MSILGRNESGGVSILFLLSWYEIRMDRWETTVSRCDQTGPLPGNPADDTLPDLRCMADIFLPREKGTLAAHLPGVVSAAFAPT